MNPQSPYSYMESLHKVLKMLLAKGKITRDMITILDKWRHSGFNVFFGSRILPRHEKSIENPARYIIRASFSQERMIYHRETDQVGYKSKDGKETRVFDARECLAAMCSHVPGKGKQMVRYYGHYSNVARGKRKKADADVTIPCILIKPGSSIARMTGEKAVIPMRNSIFWDSHLDPVCR